MTRKELIWRICFGVVGFLVLWLLIASDILFKVGNKMAEQVVPNVDPTKIVAPKKKATTESR
jgi:hypothetical protein